MPAPTPLDVATQSVQRLVKEEKSYHKELDTQNSRVAKIESEISAGTGDENAEYVLKQEVGSLLVISFTHKHLLSSTFAYMSYGRITNRDAENRKQQRPRHKPSSDRCVSASRRRCRSWRSRLR